MPAIAAGAWAVGGASALGSAHRRRGKPNQDSIGWTPRGGRGASFVAAVSDGHGGEAHHRSDVGSRLAVEAALSTLEWFNGAPDETDVAAMVAQLVAAWRQAALSHAAGQAPREAWVGDGHGGGHAAAWEALKPYGATLVALAAGRDAMLALQVGDGDLLLGLPSGRILRPLPQDEGLVGEQTYSLCLPDAASRFRGTVLRRGRDPWPDFAMLSTDGVSKSFADDDAFLAVGRHYRGAMRAGDPAAGLAPLEDWLADVSRRGSGDDATACFASWMDMQQGSRQG